MNMIRSALLAGVFIASVGAAQASTYNFTVVTGKTVSSSGFATTPTGGAAAFVGPTATASFQYTGPLNFNNTAPQNTVQTGDLNSTFFATAAPPSAITGYVGAGLAGTFADFTSKASFLNSSGSIAGYTYASFYTIDLGVLAAGTILTITHDDGVSVFQGASAVGSTVVGPTSVTTDKVVLTASADTMLYYSRQNGTPSILQVTVPEPISLSILGVGLIGLGLARRRKTIAA